MKSSTRIALIGLTAAAAAAPPSVLRAEAAAVVYDRIAAPALSRSNVGPEARDHDGDGDVEGALLFEVRYDPLTASGDLVSRDVGLDGAIEQDVVDANGNTVQDKANWRASAGIDALAPAVRRIVTSGRFFDDRQGGRRFVWDQAGAGADALNGHTAAAPAPWGLDGSGMEDLKARVDAGADDTAKVARANALLDYLRGDPDNEQANGGAYRTRASRLGAIVHSTPLYVGAPGPNASRDFVAAHRARVPMVYVGANDGMLHALRADDGSEVFAYVPRAVLDDLARLSDPVSAPGYSVDGSPTAAEVYGAFPRCDGQPCWRTLLVGGLDAGGAAVFALDVTDPVADIGADAHAEGKAAGLFLWEVAADLVDTSAASARPFAELGRSFSRPIIGKQDDGRWVVVFGDGDAEGGDGGAALFVVDAVSGRLLQKIALEHREGELSGGNGLSSPVGWDEDADGDLDRIYAGDLQGGLWGFSWHNKAGAFAVVHRDDAGRPAPLIRVTDPQHGRGLPITTAPQVSLDPAGERVVLFATGKLRDGADAGSGLRHGVFGVRDVGRALGTDPALTSRALVRHSAACGSATGSCAGPVIHRIVAAPQAQVSDAVGWRLELEYGERVVNDPVLTSARLSFTTVNPLVESNHNFHVSVDYASGAAPPQPFFDINGDGDIDAHDRLDVDGDGSLDSVAVGRFLGAGTVSAPVHAALAADRDGVYITYAQSATDMPGDSVAGTDPGLRGGHFDHDVFACELCGARGCFGRDSCHSHAYDDKWDVSGVNMLEPGGVVVRPSDPRTATGILERDQGAVHDVIAARASTAPGCPDAPPQALDVYPDTTLSCSGPGIEESQPGSSTGAGPVAGPESGTQRLYENHADTEIWVNIVNPYPADTEVDALERRTFDAEASRALPEDATLIVGCADPLGRDKDGGVGPWRYEGPVVDYHEKHNGFAPGRTRELYNPGAPSCRIAYLTDLIVALADINYLRAVPHSGCVSESLALAPQAYIDLPGMGNEFVFDERQDRDGVRDAVDAAGRSWGPDGAALSGSYCYRRAEPATGCLTRTQGEVVRQVYAPGNGPYRDGALTLQLVRSQASPAAGGSHQGGGRPWEVIWESSVYEHLPADALQGADAGTAPQCGGANEWLRQHKQPQLYGMDDASGAACESGCAAQAPATAPPDGAGTEITRLGGGRGTDVSDESAALHAPERVSWRQLLPRR